MKASVSCSDPLSFPRAPLVLSTVYRLLSGLRLQPAAQNLDKLVNLQVIIQSFLGSSSFSQTDAVTH